MIDNSIKLIEKAKQGDQKALEELINIHYDTVYGYLVKNCHDINTAQDIMQDTIIKVILNIRKYKPISQFSTWMIQIAINQYRDYLRKNKRTKNIEDYPNLQDNKSVEDMVIQNNKKSQIDQILMQLPEDKRMVFILKNDYDYSYQEIAKIMTCPIGTVRSRLHYCIMKLQILYKEKFDDTV